MAAKPDPRRGLWRCPECGHAENEPDDVKCAKCDALRPFKRAGLHKLLAGCGASMYATVAQLEEHGLPECKCGSPFLPDEVELAFLLGLSDAPAVVEYQRRLQGAEMAQARSLGWGKASERRSAGTLNSMSLKVAADMRAERRAAARENRLQALRPAAEPIPF